MGFRIKKESIKSNLCIKKENFNEAFDFAKQNALNEADFIRVKKEEIEASTNLLEFISAMRWDTFLDKDGNLVNVSNNNLNIGDEELLFKSIAQFVKNGSFLEYEREGYNGDVKERFDFLNKNVTKITYNKELDLENNCYYK